MLEGDHPPDTWLVGQRGEMVGLDASAFGTHSLRRTRVAIIKKRTSSFPACRLLHSHSKLEITVRYLGTEADNELSKMDKTDLSFI